jgi:GWxTD domain-containing protein
VRSRILAGAALALLPVILAVAQADQPHLSERYRKWLEEDVATIIRPVERDVFLKLGTDRERDLFIEAFWKHRDPTPDSPENEFKTEHYNRIAYANQYLGRDAPVPGWKTDRGRMYILLGAPDEIQRIMGKSTVCDCEVWFYQGKTELGLPPGFYLLFFKEHGQGMFRLYSPVRDGPQALLVGVSTAPGDYQKAYQALYDIDPSLAGIAMNLVPGESAGGMGRPSMSSDLLIQRIETLPARTVKDSYARKFLEYKDLVEVEYSANYLDADSLFKVFREPSGQYFVHYAIEPRRLSVNQYGTKMSTTLRINGRVTTLDGRTVYQYDKTVPVDLPEARLAELSRSPFDLHDILPLVGGDFRLSVLVKNEASKEFVSVEQAVRVPSEAPVVQMTQPVLGYKVKRVDAAEERRIRAFRVGPYQVFCQPGRVFTAGDTLAIVFQIFGLPTDRARSVQVRLAFLKDDAPFREITRSPAEFPDLPDCLEEIPLAGFPPAHYRVKVALLDAGAEVAAAGEEFDLTFAASVGRPWTSSRVLPEWGHPIYDQVIGIQLFNLGRAGDALAFLERAYRASPDSLAAAYGLARAHMALAEYPKALQVLSPFISRSERTPSEAFVVSDLYGIYLLAGEAYRRTGDFGRAIEVLDRALNRFGVNAVLLNAIGESYLGLGKPSEALAAFEKSLQLSPDQPEVRKKAEELKKKR